MNRILILLAAVAAFAGGLFASQWFKSEPVELTAGTALTPPRPVAAFSLAATNDRGQLSVEDLRGDWTLMFFGFTRCPDICPNTLQQLARVRADIAERQVTPPNIVLVTVDPEYDTVERLSSYADYFGAGVTGVTGTSEAIAALTDDLGIVYQRVPLENGEYTMDHSAAVLLLDNQAQLAAVFSPPLRRDAIADDLIALIRSTP